jgi:hypothetical protein
MSKKILLVAVLATALFTAVALAAPDRKGSLTPGGPAFSWTGGPLTGTYADSDAEAQAPCDVPQTCDQTLLQVDAGQVTVDTSSDDPNSVDMDLFVYKSDKDGTQGDLVKSSAGGDPTEHVSFEATAGYYLVKMTPAIAAGGTYKGKASELPLPPPPSEQTYGNDPTLPSSGGGSQGAGGQDGSGSTSGSGGGQATSLADDLAPTTTARRPGGRRVRTLTGTARDRDGRVAYVDVGLVRIAGKRCSSLTASGRFVRIKKCGAPRFLRARGTTSWSLALRHALASGRYVLYARATDNLGRIDAGFGAANSKRFTIRR